MSQGFQLAVLPTEESQQDAVENFAKRCLLSLDHAPYSVPKFETLQKCIIGLAFVPPKDAPGELADNQVNRIASTLQPLDACIEIIGYIAVKFHDVSLSHLREGSAVGYIASLVVASGWRRKHVGTQLLDLMVQYGKQHQNATRFMLHVMRDAPTAEPARSFYAQKGFRVNRLLRNYYGAGIDAQGMVLDVPPVVRKRQRAQMSNDYCEA